jgi:hypothetical protein
MKRRRPTTHGHRFGESLICDHCGQHYETRTALCPAKQPKEPAPASDPPQPEAA